MWRQLSHSTLVFFSLQMKCHLLNSSPVQPSSLTSFCYSPAPSSMKGSAEKVHRSPPGFLHSPNLFLPVHPLDAYILHNSWESSDAKTPNHPADPHLIWSCTSLVPCICPYAIPLYISSHFSKLSKFSRFFFFLFFLLQAWSCLDWHCLQFNKHLFFSLSKL